MKLDLTSDHIHTSMIVEASAGTGKTYAVAALVARELAVRDDLRIGHILITTFTRNAAMELRHRIRKRLISTASDLRGSSVDGYVREGRIGNLLTHAAQSVARRRGKVLASA